MESVNLPLVSIIITSFNRQNSIHESIESALRQDYENFEVIISDNCSSDNSDEVIKMYISDKRVKYYRNETNIGMLKNFQKCIYNLASGDYFTIVNSDDFLLDSSFLSKAVRLTNIYPDLNIVKGRYIRSSVKDNRETQSNFKIINEFYYGYEWLEDSSKFSFEDIIEIVGWAGIFIKRKPLIQTNSFELPTENIDAFATIFLLFNGNIAFIDSLVYNYRTLEDRVEYQSNGIDKTYIMMLQTVDLLRHGIIHNDKLLILDRFCKRYELYIIRYFILLIYRNSKKDFSELKKFLLRKYPISYREVINTSHWKIYRVVYFFPSIGRLVSETKKVVF